MSDKKYPEKFVVLSEKVDTSNPIEPALVYVEKTDGLKEYSAIHSWLLATGIAFSSLSGCVPVPVRNNFNPASNPTKITDKVLPPIIPMNPTRDNLASSKPETPEQKKQRRLTFIKDFVEYLHSITDKERLEKMNKIVGNGDVSLFISEFAHRKDPAIDKLQDAIYEQIEKLKKEFAIYVIKTFANFKSYPEKPDHSGRPLRREVIGKYINEVFDARNYGFMTETQLALSSDVKDLMFFALSAHFLREGMFKNGYQFDPKSHLHELYVDYKNENGKVTITPKSTDSTSSLPKSRCLPVTALLVDLLNFLRNEIVNPNNKNNLNGLAKLSNASFLLGVDMPTILASTEIILPANHIALTSGRWALESTMFAANSNRGGLRKKDKVMGSSGFSNKQIEEKIASSQPKIVHRVTKEGEQVLEIWGRKKSPVSNATRPNLPFGASIRPIIPSETFKKHRRIGSGQKSLPINLIGALAILDAATSLLKDNPSEEQVRQCFRDYELALNFFQKSSGQVPTTLLNNLASVLIQLGKLPAAREYYKRSLKIDSNNFMISLYGQADVAFHENNFKAANENIDLLFKKIEEDRLKRKSEGRELLTPEQDALITEVKIKGLLIKAESLEKLNRFPAALRSLRQSMALMKKAGLNDLTWLHANYLLGTYLKKDTSKKCREGLNSLKISINEQETVQNVPPSFTARARSAYLLRLQQCGQVRTAAKLEKKFGIKNYEDAKMLAARLMTAKKYEQALALLQSDGYNSLDYGTNYDIGICHENIARNNNNLAVRKFNTGNDYPEAKKLFLSALDSYNLALSFYKLALINASGKNKSDIAEVVEQLEKVIIPRAQQNAEINVGNLQAKILYSQAIHLYNNLKEKSWGNFQKIQNLLKKCKTLADQTTPEGVKLLVDIQRVMENSTWFCPDDEEIKPKNPSEKQSQKDCEKLKQMKSERKK